MADFWQQEKSRGVRLVRSWLGLAVVSWLAFVAGAAAVVIGYPEPERRGPVEPRVDASGFSRGATYDRGNALPSSPLSAVPSSPLVVETGNEDEKGGAHHPAASGSTLGDMAAMATPALPEPPAVPVTPKDRLAGAEAVMMPAPQPEPSSAAATPSSSTPKESSRIAQQEGTAQTASPLALWQRHRWWVIVLGEYPSGQEAQALLDKGRWEPLVPHAEWVIAEWRKGKKRVLVLAVGAYPDETSAREALFHLPVRVLLAQPQLAPATALRERPLMPSAASAR